MTPSPYPAPFTSAHLRANIVKILLIVGAIATGISLITQVLSFPFPPIQEGQELEENMAGFAVALVLLLVGVLDFLIYLTTVVFFCVWLYRAHDNLRAFNNWPRLEYSSGLAVGSFFIPFANLVIPYRAVREVWQKSEVPEETMLGLSDPPASFPIWWMFWLLASFAEKIAIRLSYDRFSESTATIVSIGASGLFILAAVFAFLVVDAIDRKQEETAEKLQLGRFARPQPPPSNLVSEPVMNQGSFSGQ
jgi:hypothetical protein